MSLKPRKVYLGSSAGTIAGNSRAVTQGIGGFISFSVNVLPCFMTSIWKSCLLSSVQHLSYFKGRETLLLSLLLCGFPYKSRSPSFHCNNNCSLLACDILPWMKLQWAPLSISVRVCLKICSDCPATALLFTLQDGCVYLCLLRKKALTGLSNPGFGSLGIQGDSVVDSSSSSMISDEEMNTGNTRTLLNVFHR